MSSQLPLALRWPAQQRFDSYVPGGNGVALALLRDAAVTAQASWVFVAGAAGCGKSHLLIAACAQADAAGRSAQYLPLRRLRADAEAAARPGLAGALRALGGGDLLALDDIDAIAGDAAAEHALFDLYNRGKVDKSTMLFSASAAPSQIGIGLPDLVSRLSACAQAALRPLSDDDRRVALRRRAHARGLTLDDGVLDWLFAHTQRDLGSLTALLDRLDRESLAAQRRITVPFLRQVLETEPKPRDAPG
ncbi:MAG TPA: DnaA regulatory inactivator Hda [Rudaea sp.]|nr:DnaA regulatory inactivator Hda [Rudaea sp.]